MENPIGKTRRRIGAATRALRQASAHLNKTEMLEQRLNELNHRVVVVDSERITQLERMLPEVTNLLQSFAHTSRQLTQDNKTLREQIETLQRTTPTK